MVKRKVKACLKTDSTEKKAPPVLKLPKQWPMATKRASSSPHENEALAPGPSLRSCGGTDVQLSRGATSLPNLEKAKGKFLIVLPGIMSLRPPAKSKKELFSSQDGATTVSLTQDTEAAASSSAETAVSLTQDSSDQDLREKSAEEGDGDKKPATSRSTAAKLALPTMGSIENLGTDAPLLKVPFDDGRVLVFNGKKIESSSKFMMLTCKGNKKSVTCKGIFHSAIVFGEGAWQSDRAAVVSESGAVCLEDDGSPFNNYGSSDRTVDGGNSGGSTRVVRKRVAVAQRKTAPLLSEDDEAIVIHSDDSDPEQVELVMDHDSSEDEYVDVGRSGGQEASAPRRKSRRSAGKATVRYTDSAETDSDEEGSTSGEDEGNEEAGSTTKSQMKKAIATSNKAAAATANDEADDSEADDDTYSVSSRDAEENQIPRRKTPRRSTTKTNPIYLDTDKDSSDEDEETEDKENETKGRATKAIASRKSERSTEIIEIELDEDSNDDKPSIRARKRKSSPRDTVDRDDYVATSDEDAQEAPTKRRKAPRRSAAKIQYVDLSESEDDDKELKSDEESVEAKNEKKIGGKRRSNRPTQRTQRAQNRGSEVDVIEVGGNDSKPKNIRKRTATGDLEVLGVVNAEGTAMSSTDSKTKSLLNAKKSTDVNSEEEVTSKASASPEPKSPSPTSRRPRFSPSWSRKKRSPAKRKVDMSNDDEFTFL